MSEFLKPQSPLQHKDGAYIYPLTTADQVILENGNRLNTALNDMSSKPKAGFIYPLASSIVPDGFLLCDGAEYSRTEFPELFAAIGTIYGNGDGSTTFNVPNLQTRVPVGAGEGYGLGTTGGEAEHTLITKEMPKHRHTLNNITWGGSQPSNYGSSGYLLAYQSPSEYPVNDDYFNTTGGSQPHNNMQPYTVVNYIIATGKDTSVSVSDIVMGAQAIPLGVEYGGTGATNAEEARQNLGITPENIGAISMELLWENASPDSEFPSQTLKFDIAEDEFFLILYKTATDDGARGSLIVRNYVNTGWLMFAIYAGIYLSHRRINIFKQGELTFESANENVSYATKVMNNSKCIPQFIYKIKGASA